MPPNMPQCSRYAAFLRYATMPWYATMPQKGPGGPLVRREELGHKAPSKRSRRPVKQSTPSVGFDERTIQRRRRTFQRCRRSDEPSNSYSYFRRDVRNLARPGISMIFLARPRWTRTGSWSQQTRIGFTQPDFDSGPDRTGSDRYIPDSLKWHKIH